MSRIVVNKHVDDSSLVVSELFNEEHGKGEIVISNEVGAEGLYIINANGDVVEISGKNNNISSLSAVSLSDVSINEEELTPYNNIYLSGATNANDAVTRILKHIIDNELVTEKAIETLRDYCGFNDYLEYESIFSGNTTIKDDISQLRKEVIDDKLVCEKAIETLRDNCGFDKNLAYNPVFSGSTTVRDDIEKLSLGNGFIPSSSSTTENKEEIESLSGLVQSLQSMIIALSGQNVELASKVESLETNGVSNSAVTNLTNEVTELKNSNLALSGLVETLSSQTDNLLLDNAILSGLVETLSAKVDELENRIVRNDSHVYLTATEYALLLVNGSASTEEYGVITYDKNALYCIYQSSSSDSGGGGIIDEPTDEPIEEVVVEAPEINLETNEIVAEKAPIIEQIITDDVTSEATVDYVLDLSDSAYIDEDGYLVFVTKTVKKPSVVTPEVNLESNEIVAENASVVENEGNYVLDLSDVAYIDEDGNLAFITKKANNTNNTTSNSTVVMDIDTQSIEASASSIDTENNVWDISKTKMTLDLENNTLNIN